MREFKYSIGDIITTNSDKKIKIIKQFRQKTGSESSNRKWYKYQCLSCGCESDMLEKYIITGHGCPVCCSSPQKVVIGINDMWTTNPEQAKLLANPEDGYKYSKSANVKADWKCGHC